ncbi:MAG: response regulator transcription factor [Bacteroidia bacterium]|nr:response regulator transcription factor [Bacteroidia bacterium]
MMTNTISYTAIIVDDEKSNRLILNTLLKKGSPEIEVIFETDDIEEAFVQINKLKPDLLFLDIQMPKGGGFTLLKKFKEYPFEVIFVTSFDKYALNAIKASALDYLLKPVERADLKAAVEKFKHVQQKKLGVTNNPLLQNLVTESDKKVAIHHKGNVILLPIKDINYIEADINYTNVFTDTTSFYLPKTLGEWEEILLNHINFIRINKSMIVNTIYCSYYEKGDPIVLVLKNNIKGPVSRRRRAEVLEKLKQ